LSKQHAAFQDLIRHADAAGQKAVEDANVTAMIVYSPRDPVASLLGGDDGGPDLSRPVYHVPDGVCGFAWVNCKATATEGRKFLNWLKGSVKSSKPFSDVQPASTMEPRTDSYYKGVSIWIGGFNQSMQKKEAYGRAFAKALNEAGINGLSVYCMSRMD
jgi:hypothetical protein